MEIADTYIYVDNNNNNNNSNSNSNLYETNQIHNK